MHSTWRGCSCWLHVNREYRCTQSRVLGLLDAVVLWGADPSALYVQTWLDAQDYSSAKQQQLTSAHDITA